MRAAKVKSGCWLRKVDDLIMIACTRTLCKWCSDCDGRLPAVVTEINTLAVNFSEPMKDYHVACTCTQRNFSAVAVHVFARRVVRCILPVRQ